MSYPIKEGKAAWEYKAIPSLTKGVDYGKRSDLLADDQAVTLKNVLVKQNTIFADTGYKRFSDPVLGIPQAERQFKRPSNVHETLLITTLTLYKWDDGSQSWHLVKGTAGTTIATLALSGDTIPSFTVVSAAGFASGELIAISLADGGQWHTTIVVSGTTFFLTNPIIGVRPLIGAAVIRAVILNGDLGDQISVTDVPSHDWFVFTNGVDIVKRYDGTDCVDVPGMPSGGNVVCKAVATYNAALFLFNTVEGGTHRPQRVRRSNQADPTDWVGGTAGTDELLDEADAILQAANLGPYLVVYRDNSVARGEFIGAGGVNYDFKTVVTEDGAISTQSVVNMDTYHIFVGNKNVYEYRGGYEVTPIGYEIFQRVWGDRGILNPTQKGRSFAFHITELDEVWFVYPDTFHDNPNKVWRYSREYKMWYEREFTYNQFVGFGLFLSTKVFTWADLQGSWKQQTWAWDAVVTNDNSASVHLLAEAPNQVYDYDYITVLDNGNGVKYTVETKDFLVPDKELRFDMIEMMIKGTDVTVEYSIDEGKHWALFPQAPYTVSSGEKTRDFVQFVYEKIRFRWTGVGADFMMKWFAFLYKDESLW